MPHLPPMLPDPESRLAHYLDMASLAEEFAFTTDDARNRADWTGLAECWRFVADSYADLLHLRGIALPGQTPFTIWRMSRRISMPVNSPKLEGGETGRPAQWRLDSGRNGT